MSEISVFSLVRHPKHSGIGVVLHVGIDYNIIRFGLRSELKVANLLKSELIVIKTPSNFVSANDYFGRPLKPHSTLNKCIVGNELHVYKPGVGWTVERVIEEKDLTKYPILER